MKRTTLIPAEYVQIAIIIFFVVGVVGLQFSSTHQLFLDLVPAFLCLVLGLLLLKHPQWNLKFGLWAILVFVIGFSAEWVGVHTGKLFGHYVYGKVLGPKLDGIPLVIGVNWVILAYCCRDIAGRFIKAPILRILIASLLMVLLDLSIEPVAQNLHFWIWSGFHIPLSNYYGWFIVSALIFAISERFFDLWGNPSSVHVYLCMFLFFTLLNVMR